MKKALILNNAYLATEHYLYQSRRLREELEALGVSVDVLANDGFFAAVDEDGSVDLNLGGYDFCIYLDKDKYVPYLLERAGLRLFNSAAAVEACDDKMTTFIRLIDAGVRVPYTMPAAVCFDPAVALPDTLFEQVEHRLGYPFVLKSSFGSLGKGVYEIDDRDAFRRAEKALQCTPHLYQRFVTESYGRDVRVIVVGGKVVSAMERRSAGDFRSNIELGGSATPYEVPDELASTCAKVASTLGLDFCGIDFLFGDEGFLLCEVNSNAFFGGMERTTGVNVAKAYAQYVFDSIYK